MFTKLLIRSLYTGPKVLAIEKSNLATLRKKTGYTFANCKKALELNKNDLTEAEKWLKEQAQTLGWSKATKLEGRQTTQGLVGIMIKNKAAALVEINCETDFVARNEHFQEMVANAANSCLEFSNASRLTGNLIKMSLDSEQLSEIKSRDGKTLADHLALMIGTVGENATLKRATMYKSNESDVHISGYAHPSGVSKSGILLGRFGGIIAIKSNATKDINIDDLGKKLCQHIVGMDPKLIGTIDDKPNKSSDDEQCLIYQEYLLDESLIVKDVLDESEIEILDFKRFGCGEQQIIGTQIVGEKQSLETIETCQ